MKRFHLFEFEDQSWFPNWLRMCLTRLIVVAHKLVGSTEIIQDELSKLISSTGEQRIVDLCSGSGGPMIQVIEQINQEKNDSKIHLTLSDLYPNTALTQSFDQNPNISYLDRPVDATKLEIAPEGVKTMICSFHHMPPDQARNILQSACSNKETLLIYEMSDNSYPAWLWWTAIPTNIIMCFFITPFVRPLTWQQLLFTYLIPIIPICFAWDGAVSNARTYTVEDMNELLSNVRCENYNWDIHTIKQKGRKLIIIGQPE